MAGKKQIEYPTTMRSFYLGGHHIEALRRLAFQRGLTNSSQALRVVLDMVAEDQGVDPLRFKAAS